MTDFSHLRQNYVKAALTRASLCDDPVQQFATWMNHALAANIAEPYAMTLATADATGKPSARIVLLRQYSSAGFEFYTNYDSQKGHDLTVNPQGELMFFWAALEQQIRIYGKIEKISEADSIAYFHKRPTDSQIAAHASAPQSGVIADRATLETNYKVLHKQFANQVIPKPTAWGGYRLIPESFEFWQGRANRMHDRLRYRQQEGTWLIERLMP